jgi:predicted RND superfamily exporter protein
MVMDDFVRDLFYSLLGASLVIFGVMGVFFRSLRLGLIAILPNLLPLFFTLGYMGLRGYPLNAGNMIVFAISLGVAVDDTIHFLARFREERRHGVGVQDALRRTLRGAGRAIVMTTVLIVGGLSILFLSDFTPTRRFAELISVTMVCALVGDLVVLPACLAVFAKETEAEGEPALSEPSGLAGAAPLPSEAQ